MSRYNRGWKDGFIGKDPYVKGREDGRSANRGCGLMIFIFVFVMVLSRCH